MMRGAGDVVSGWHNKPNSAIANIMPDWKQADVLEGDQVVY